MKNEDSGLVRQVLAAQGFLELGMIEDAMNALEEIEPEKKTDIRVLAMRAAICRRAEAWGQLEVVASFLVRQQPSNARWWVEWAYATRRAKSLEEAERVLLRAVEIHPSEAVIHFNLGCYACQMGRIEDAKARIARAVKLDRRFQVAALKDPDLEPMWVEFGKIEG
jgi:Flp pilus assembly protein TadD